jgi:hypothetical protein
MEMVPGRKVDVADAVVMGLVRSPPAFGVPGISRFVDPFSALAADGYLITPLVVHAWMPWW